MSLYTAETRRLSKRRFTRFFVLIALIVLGLLAGGTAYTHEKTTARTRAAAEAAADRAYQEQLGYAEQARQDCRKDPTSYGGNCDGISPPTRDQISAEQFLTPPFDFRADFPALVIAWAALLALVAFIIGASFVGAEWNSGGMMNLLLWRPQRLRVLSTKLSALLTWLAGLGVLSGAAWTGLFWLIATLRGSTAGMTPGAWQSLGLTGLRGLGLVLMAGAIGFGAASIGRHTAAALGVAIGVIVIFQFGLAIVLELARVRFYEAYLLPAWIGAWMVKSYDVVDYRAPCVYSATNSCEPPVLTITWQMAGGLFAAVSIIIVGVAMWTIRKRDIT
ncbi:ABC transporter permease subunit [Actinoplanes siamensis]|uniref:ABC transporter permease subunit n=1 Tax=Actinoplanes siamensis TaxID=1223317 RepID=UPI001944CC4E|nr:ABC transporter permease subunit [Actinoplanes siamensis]